MYEVSLLSWQSAGGRWHGGWCVFQLLSISEYSSSLRATHTKSPITRVCTISPNNFCCVCGQHTVSKNEFSIPLFLWKWRTLLDLKWGCAINIFRSFLTYYGAYDQQTSETGLNTGVWRWILLFQWFCVSGTHPITSTNATFAPWTGEEDQNPTPCTRSPIS